MKWKPGELPPPHPPNDFDKLLAMLKSIDYEKTYKYIDAWQPKHKDVKYQLAMEFHKDNILYALMKRIARKPYRQYQESDANVYDGYRCPSCRRRLKNYKVGKTGNYEYCPKCGQHLDYTDVIKELETRTHDRDKSKIFGGKYDKNREVERGGHD